MIHPVHTKYGERFQCYKCGCKFYDMGKKESICPRCGIDQAEAPSPEEKLFATRMKEEDDVFVKETLTETVAEQSDDDAEDSDELDIVEGSDAFDSLEGEDDEEM